MNLTLLPEIFSLLSCHLYSHIWGNTSLWCSAPQRNQPEPLCSLCTYQEPLKSELKLIDCVLLASRNTSCNWHCANTEHKAALSQSIYNLGSKLQKNWVGKMEEEGGRRQSSLFDHTASQKQKKKILLDWWSLQALGKSVPTGHWQFLHQSRLHFLAWNNFCQNDQGTAPQLSTWNVL